jgi:GntR family transcriptional regulator
MLLNPHAPIPLYRQLAERLAAAIRNGEYAAGGRIPSEHVLARDFAIGRPTVRQAIDLLVRKGLLARRRGSGTYVCEARQEVDLFSLDGTAVSFQKVGLPVENQIISPLSLADVPPQEENPFGGARAWRLSRLTRCDGIPIVLEDIYLDADLFAGLEQIELGGRSLSRIAEEHYFLRPSGAKQRFRIAYAGDELARRLEVDAEAPLLFVQRYLHFPLRSDGVYVELWCRSDRFVFSQTIGGALYA